MKRLFLLLALLAWSFAWAAVSSGETAASGERILIGISNVQAGPAQFLGVELSRGAMAWFRHVNDNGGVYGRMIHVVQYNDGYEPVRCIENTQRLLDKDKVFALFGYVGTPTSKAVSPMVRQAQVPFFFPFTGAGFLRDVKVAPTVFNLRASYDMETEAMVDHLVSQGKTRVGVFYQDDSYGRAGLAGVVKAMEKRGLKPAARGAYKRNTTAVNRGLVVMKRANPQAVIIIGTYKPAAEFIKRARKLRMGSMDFLNISFVGGEALARELGPEGDGVIVSQVMPPPLDASLPAVAEYQQLLRRYYPGVAPSFISLEGFLDAKALVEALNRVGPELTRERLLRVTNDLRNYDPGIHETVNFAPFDHQGLDKVFLTVIRGGEFQLL